MRSIRLAALALVALLLPAAGAHSLPLPAAPACPVFPADNPWNRRVDALPVAADSDAIIDSIGAGTGLHPDFGSGTWNGGPIGIPITVVSGASTPTYQVPFLYASQSDPGPYPIPSDVAIEGDRARRATGTRSSSTATPAGSTSSTRSTRGPAAGGGPTRARSGTCARTSSGPRAGRRRTRPGCRSSPASRASTRSRAA